MRRLVPLVQTRVALLTELPALVRFAFVPEEDFTVRELIGRIVGWPEELPPAEESHRR